jgi:hypothetical protein
MVKKYTIAYIIEYTKIQQHADHTINLEGFSHLYVTDKFRENMEFLLLKRYQYKHTIPTVNNPHGPVFVAPNRHRAGSCTVCRRWEPRREIEYLQYWVAYF